MQARPASGKRRILVAYFSWSGNTREIANQIHKIVGGDLFEIVTVNRYPSDYDETVRQARKELETSCRPQLASEVEDIESYDLVFIGYPNWCYTIPAPVASFLSKCDSTEKTIAPFCTHGGDRLGESVEDIAKLCQRSLVLEGLAVRGSEVRNAQSKVSEWLRKIRVVE
jgi:flavodoxin